MQTIIPTQIALYLNGRVHRVRSTTRLQIQHVTRVNYINNNINNNNNNRYRVEDHS